MALKTQHTAFVQQTRERYASAPTFNASVTAQLLDLAIEKATRADLHRIVLKAAKAEQEAV